MKMTLITILILTSKIAFGACNESDFVTSPDSEVTLEIQGHHYSPPCLIVKPGTKITIPASGNHPLQGVQVDGSPENPFVSAVAAESTQTKALSAPGTFPFFCTRHGNAQGQGMAGTIVVSP